MARKMTKVAVAPKVIKTATKNELVSSLDFLTSTDTAPPTLSKRMKKPAMKKPAGANKKRPAAADTDVPLDDAIVESTATDRNKKRNRGSEHGGYSVRDH